MSIIAPDLPGAEVVDLFAGSGALGIEALSRGAARATFVESNPGVLRVLNRNLSDLAIPADRFRVVRDDAVRFVDGLNRGAYDIALADPPYAGGFGNRLVEIFEGSPFARLLCLEHSRDETLPSDFIWRERRYGDTILSFFRAADDR